MYISSLSNLNHKQNIPFRKNNLNNLLGTKQFNDYGDKIEQKFNSNLQKNNYLINILYNSIYLFLSKGKYNSAKVLADDLAARTDLGDDTFFTKLQADIYKHTGDTQSALSTYSKLSNIAKSDEYAYKLDALKNYAEINIEKSGKPFINVSNLGKIDEPVTEMVYLYLRSLEHDKNGYENLSHNEISSAYTLMKSRSIVDDSIILNKSLSLANKGDIAASNKLITSRLDKLTQENKVYTTEFLNYMLLLGANTFIQDNTTDKYSSINIMKNASKIADEIGNNELKENVDFLLAKMVFNKSKDEFVAFIGDNYNKFANKDNKLKIFLMLGDANFAINKEASLKYFEMAENLINPDDKIALYNVYTKIKELYKTIPNLDESKFKLINQKINELNVFDLSNTNHLLSNIIVNLQKGNYKALTSLLSKNNNLQNDPVNEHLIKAFGAIANIHEGIDYNTNLNLLNENIINLKKDLSKNLNNDDIKRALYTIYNCKLDIFWQRNNYTGAAECIREADKYFVDKYFSEDNIKRHKLNTVLYNYKAQEYSYAEKYTNKFLDYFWESVGTQKVKDLKDADKRKLASFYETLGLINLKMKNFADSTDYFEKAVEIRERLLDRDIKLANSYSALARISILTGWRHSKYSSKEMHSKALEILNAKYPNDSQTKDEQDFHKKYYGYTLASMGKWIRLTKDSYNRIIDKFIYYNEDLNLCE